MKQERIRQLINESRRRNVALNEGPKNDVIEKMARMYSGTDDFSTAHWDKAEKQYSAMYDYFTEADLNVASGGLLDKLTLMLAEIASNGSKNLKDAQKAIRDFTKKNKIKVPDFEKNIYGVFFTS